MGPYELVYSREIRKDLRGIPPQDVDRILARAEALREDPRPPGSERLAGSDHYRVRQGNYRIIYSIDDVVVVVEVIRIGHRRDVYRDL